MIPCTTSVLSRLLIPPQAPYEKKAAADKERYEKEKAAYDKK